MPYPEYTTHLGLLQQVQNLVAFAVYLKDDLQPWAFWYFLLISFNSLPIERYVTVCNPICDLLAGSYVSSIELKCKRFYK